MTRSLKIRFIPIDAIGHVNASIGIAEVLIKRGHRIIFAINERWNAKLLKYGFEEELIRESESNSVEDPAKFWADVFAPIFNSSSALEKTLHIKRNLNKFFVGMTKKLDAVVSEVIDRIKPDVIILDQVLCLPSVVNSGIPWVLTCSFNPLKMIEDERTPPAGSGKFQLFLFLLFNIKSHKT